MDVRQLSTIFSPNQPAATSGRRCGLRGVLFTVPFAPITSLSCCFAIGPRLFLRVSLWFGVPVQPY